MKNIKFILIIISVIFLFNRCELSDEPVLDAGIFGSIYDSQGNLVPSDVLTKNLIVNALGEEDLSPITIPVKGDGTFRNIKLFPQNHKFWIEGPVESSDTIEIDLSSGNLIQQDFVVNPFLHLEVGLSGLSGNAAIVDYSIVENTDLIASEAEMYCSTVSYPISSIGSGAFYETKKVSVNEKSGQITFENLDVGETYYIRLGASVNGQLMNYSNQIIIKN